MNRIFLLAISVIFFKVSYSQSIVYNESQSDSLTQKADSILIIGVGSLENDIFLDYFSKEMISELKKKKIYSVYYFLGQSLSEAKKDFDTINKAGYNAILYLLPKGASSYNIMYSSNQTYVHGTRSTGQITTNSGRVPYEAGFTFQLCKQNEKKDIVWESGIQVYCDLRKKHIPNQLAHKVLKRFKELKYTE